MNVRANFTPVELEAAKRRRLTTVQKLAVAELLADGRDPRIIAAAFRCGPQTIKKIATEGPLVPRPKARA